MRGKHATKPMEEVIAEARELAADGVRELVIVAQDTTYYGMDLYGEPRLPQLLRELEKVEGLDWIRLMYLYPMYFTDELIDVDRRSRSGSCRTSTCRCSTSTTDAQADAAPREPGRHRSRCSTSCAERFRTS